MDPRPSVKAALGRSERFRDTIEADWAVVEAALRARTLADDAGAARIGAADRVLSTLSILQFELYLRLPGIRSHAEAIAFDERR